jgi:O-antigen ligase
MKSKDTRDYAIHVTGILSLFFFAYVFLLPFVKIGIPVSYYRVTFSDSLVVIIFFVIVCTRGKRVVSSLDAPLGRWLGVILIMILSFLPSAIHSRQMLHLGLEILPYMYALLLSFITAFFLTIRRDDGVRRLIFAYQAGFLAAMIPAVLSFFIHFEKFYLRIFYNNAQKYQFLCISPNQFSSYALVALMLTVLFLRSRILMSVLLFICAGVGIFMSGSRTGALVYLFLLLYFLARLALSVMKGQMSRRLFFICLSAILFFALIFIIFLKERFWNIDRSLSGIVYVLQGKVGDPYRMDQFRQCLAQFRAHPLTGIGLGEYLYISPDGHEIHNTFLSILTETGILGFAGFLFLQCYLVLAIIRSKRIFLERSAGIAVLIASWLYMNAHHILRERWVWFLYGIILGLYSMAQDKREGPRCAG